jgi:hypothetical protein
MSLRVLEHWKLSVETLFQVMSDTLNDSSSNVSSSCSTLKAHHYINCSKSNSKRLGADWVAFWIDPAKYIMYSLHAFPHHSHHSHQSRVSGFVHVLASTLFLPFVPTPPYTKDASYFSRLTHLVLTTEQSHELLPRLPGGCGIRVEFLGAEEGVGQGLGVRDVVIRRARK